MTQRILALSLLVLAASPFTAPFTTCDLATLFGHAMSTTLALHVAPIASNDAATIGDNAALTVPTLASTIEPGNPCAALLCGWTTSTSETRRRAPSWAFRPMRLPDGQPAASSVLRI